ncbi:deleted in malignant brain tumors 1 protein isoform X2 [Magallana gigas]|uniref:deleted in malignant brain tumors 1 protein isoform X2 n=1 Tax=Magallana gigas TaxID=29159 RepID=UPI00333E64D0
MRRELRACEVLIAFCFFIEIEAYLYQREGLVRLVGGPTQYEGRLEVYKSGRWGTVCDDILNNSLSVVVCRSLGLPWKTSEAYGNAKYGEGSGPILLDNVNCSGSETSITECIHIGWGSHDCGHSEDVSINCLPYETLRLVGGSNRYEGRLEILTQRGWGEWGTICDNHLNDKLAVVACRSLGLPSNTPEAYGGALYGQGSGPVVWQGIKCNGSESRITSCMLIGLESINGSKQCTHDHDVSINCLPTRVTAVRLYGGENELEGRLEVYKQGRWGTVCDADLNDNLAVVVCRSLGLSWNTSKAYGGAIFGEGSGPIWMDTVNCSGSEANLTECRHRGWGVSDCDHGKDVSINCLPPNEGLVRLVGGPTQYEGRLEVYKFGRWGTVCDDILNNSLSVVVCRSLGLPWKTSEAYGNAAYGEGSGPIWLNNVICSGSETSIKECKHMGWGLRYCRHSKDVSINCLPSNEILVRLVGEPTQYEGRLEVYKFGRWGTVCDDDLNNNLSVVVCRSLGLPWKTSEAYGNAVYGEGSGPIWLDNVNCFGSETSITECKHNGWGSHDCDHSKDVSINCLPPDENAVQLIGGVTDNEGRLQVYKFGRWRSVCFNELDDKLSAVVCRSLDLPWNTSMVFANEPFIDGAYKLRILCNGSERSVDKCKKQRYICQSEVFIFCLPPEEYDFRLVGEASDYEGRLLVYKLERWGTVCFDDRIIPFYDTVCQSLGLLWNSSKAVDRKRFYTEEILNCDVSERRFKECTWEHYSKCSSGKDVFISCLQSKDDLVASVHKPSNSPRQQLSINTWLISTLGAMVLLFLYKN